MARAKSAADGQSSSKAPAAGRAERRKFFLIDDQPAHDFPYDLVGEQVFYGHGFWRGSGFRHYQGTPVFRSVNGNTNRDFWVFCGYWFISDRMKVVLERVDPAAFEFLKCKVQLPDGTDGPVRWMCDILRVLDALDEEKSAVKIEADGLGRKMYGIPLPQPLVFNGDAVGSHHIFRVRYSKEVVICDEEMRLACKTAGLKGTSFDDVTLPPKWARLSEKVKKELQEFEELPAGSTSVRELSSRLLAFGAETKAFSLVIAARSVLRAIPVLERLPWDKARYRRIRGGKRVRISTSAIVLGTFRAAATAWIAAQSATFGMSDRFHEMKHDARMAGRAHDAGDTPGASAAYTTHEAMETAISLFSQHHPENQWDEDEQRRSAAGHSSRTVQVASQGFMEAYDPQATQEFRNSQDMKWVLTRPLSEAENVIWNAAWEDARRLEAGDDNVQSLLMQPLWLTPVPQYVLDDWRKLAERLRARADENWDVWIDWYAARLAGGASVSEKDEIARVSLSEDVWDQGAAAANANIAKLVG